MSFLRISFGVLMIAVALVIIFLLVDYLTFWYSQIKKQHNKKKVAKDMIGIGVLANRLEEERKRQIRHIKERDAADQELLDRAEEYRGDFDKDDC